MGWKNPMEGAIDLSLFLVSVILISMSAIMIPGPIFAVTMAKGHKDKNAGAPIALGHVIIEAPLILLIYLGFARFFTSDSTKMVIGLVGGTMLIFIGVQMFRERKSVAAESREVPYGSLTAGMITTSSNPYFFLWWGTIGSTLILTANTFGFIGFFLFVLAHWLCDFIWSLFVSAATFRSKHLWNNKIHEIVFSVCSAILVVFGLKFIISVF
jgi:threonine/homoserine/homoserine lactone efflux protein